MNMKRILHINTNKIWRGAEQQVHYLLNNSSVDYDTYLFCPENSALYNKNSSTKKDKLFIYKKRFGVDILAAIKLKNVCKQNKIDLIHLHDSHAINTYLLADFLGINIPCVIHRHVNFPVTSKWKYQHKKILKIICVSNEIKKNLSSFVEEKKLVVVNPGIDISQWSTANDQLRNELNVSSEIKLIGIVSALESEKNIEEFIVIANQISEKRNDVKFIIVGDGSLYKEFNTQNSTLNIIFLGFRNDVQQILSSLDIFLFTSKNEGFGQVLLEAMAAKVPIISSNFSAVNEIIENGKTGFIYKEVENAINNIECLIINNELRNTITEKAFNFVQQFDISLMNKKMEEVYTSIFTNY